MRSRWSDPLLHLGVAVNESGDEPGTYPTRPRFETSKLVLIATKFAVQFLDFDLDGRDTGLGLTNHGTSVVNSYRPRFSESGQEIPTDATASAMVAFGALLDEPKKRCMVEGSELGWTRAGPSALRLSSRSNSHARDATKHPKCGRCPRARRSFSFSWLVH